MSTSTSVKAVDAPRRPAATLQDVGAALRNARVARGEPLEAVAADLRIKLEYLQALEDGDYSRTPGRSYALGYLRSYAEHLDFDGGKAILLAKDSLDGRAPPPPLQIREPVEDERRSSGILVAASIVIAGIVYGGWHVSLRDGPVLDRLIAVPGEIGRFAADMMASAPEVVAAVPQGRRPPAPPANLLASAPPLPWLVSPEPQDTAPAQQLATVEVVAPAAKAAAVSATAVSHDATAAQAAEPPVARSPAELLSSLSASEPHPATMQPDSRIVLVARDSAWVQVRSPSRDFIRSKTMEAGERLALPDRSDLALWTGNAGGVEVLVDGQSLGVLGESGRVMRDVPLAIDQLKARAAGRL